jgi:hypothetical protein
MNDYPRYLVHHYTAKEGREPCKGASRLQPFTSRPEFNRKPA